MYYNQKFAKKELNVRPKIILKDIPDKRQDKDTTSLKFKHQLIEFFQDDEWRNKTCLEIGTNKGYTTRVLHFSFQKSHNL